MVVFKPTARETLGSWWFVLALIVALAAVSPLIACGGDEGGGGDDDDAAGDNGDAAADDDADDDALDDDAADDDDDASDDDAPPEPEEDVDPGTRPVSCGNAVFVLNTADSFVSSIDAVSLDVETIFTGRGPSVLRAAENCEHLVTLNTQDDTVSVIDGDTLDVANVDVRPGLNSLAVAPGGRFALAYHHFSEAGGGTMGYGEVSIVDVATQTAESLSVGFPPDIVAFTLDGETALLTSETALAVLDLVDASFRLLDTDLDPDAGQKIRKATVTPDGERALILAEASQSILVVDLDDLSVEALDLGCFPTDLDTPEGGDASLLVCREEGRVIVVDHDDLSLDDYGVTETVGSGELFADGSQAVLFTNATAVERVHLFALDDGSLATYLTVKPITGAALAPDDASAILFHQGGDGQPVDDFDEAMDTQEAFSLFLPASGLVTPVQTWQRIESVSFGELGDWAVVPIPTRSEIIVVNLRTALADSFTVASTPQDAGVIDAIGQVFVLQDHEMGRISFIDVETGKVRTVTGFLLNGGIE